MSAKRSKVVLPRGRAKALRSRQRLKMAGSVHAFVRGSTARFYEWLGSSAVDEIPKGPSVWICGDCHVGNLGPVADAKGHVEIEIRDLDQTVIGNPAHDLIRLGLSLATSIRSSDLPGVTTARMLEAMVQGYEQCFAGSRRNVAIARPKCMRVVMRRALSRTWKHLAKERIGGVSPTIPRSNAFWPLSRREFAAVQALFKIHAVRRMVTGLKSRADGAAVEFLDAAYWSKGCSSLGRLRIAVLLRVDGAKHSEDGLCLVDIKEAVRAVAPRSLNVRLIRNNSRRVVDGALHLSPYLGNRMLPARLLGRSVFLRELRPQDLKVELDRVTPAQAIESARYLAHVVGEAHAKQIDAPMRLAWYRQLRRNRLKAVNAPSWLWSSVVALLIRHEAAYLEHCRQYAVRPAKEGLKNWS